MNCYFSKNYKGFNAGNKAKTDIERIMKGLGFRNIGGRRTYHNGKVQAYFSTLRSVLKATSSVGKEDILVVQYPLKKYYEYVCRRAHARGAKVITMIHDLGSFRRKKLSVEQEIARLNGSDYVIASNEVMKEWLREQGCTARLGSLDAFDYLSATSPVAKPAEKECRVIYAGALNPRKNNFLYELESHIRDYRFTLYGGGFEPEKITRQEKFVYKGFVPSDQLIAQAEGDYGLVWDGPSITTCEGDFGEYLRFNSPHKVSLYLRCELPVIIWDQAAMAGFIRDNGAGICVNSLENLDQQLAAITPLQYTQMKENARKIGEQLAEGYFFSRAVKKAIQELAR